MFKIEKHGLKLDNFGFFIFPFYSAHFPIFVNARNPRIPCLCFYCKMFIRYKRYPLFSYSNLYTTVVRYVHRVDIIAPDSSITSIFSLSVFCKPFSHIVGLKFSNYFSYHTYCMLMLCLPNANIFPF